MKSCKEIIKIGVSGPKTFREKIEVFVHRVFCGFCRVYRRRIEVMTHSTGNYYRSLVSRFSKDLKAVEDAVIEKEKRDKKNR